MDHVGLRQVRAVYDETTVRVYQAYNHAVADAALAAGTFVSPPFSMARMTWVKPSFLWMMYRSGWASKDPGQARVLAIDVSRGGFLWALERAILSHHEPGLPYGADGYRRLLATAEVVVQWDPERDLWSRALPYRSLQVGLRGGAVRRYVEEWIVRLTDITTDVHAIKRRLDEGAPDRAAELLPQERPFPLGQDILARLNATGDSYTDG